MRALSLIMYIVQLRIYNGASQLAVVTQNFFSCRPLCEINRETFTCYFSKMVQVQLRSIHACFHQFNQANTCRCWFNTWMHTVAFAVSQHTSLHSCVCASIPYYIHTVHYIRQDHCTVRIHSNITAPKNWCSFRINKRGWGFN